MKYLYLLMVIATGALTLIMGYGAWSLFWVDCPIMALGPTFLAIASIGLMMRIMDLGIDHQRSRRARRAVSARAVGVYKGRAMIRQ